MNGLFPPLSHAFALGKLLEILNFFGSTHIAKASAAERSPTSSDLTQEICYSFSFHSLCFSSHIELKSDSLEAF